MFFFLRRLIFLFLRFLLCSLLSMRSIIEVKLDLFLCDFRMFLCAADVSYFTEFFHDALKRQNVLR